ncbi:hypothetical protein [Fulvivirga imtechensis]|nr:hypothetical protein [Fulvivirga imtechensis]
MEMIFEIASNVSTPLGLAGIIATVLFFSISQFIKAGIIAKTTKRTSGRIAILIINRLFVLAFITIFLGFLGFFLKHIVAFKTGQTHNEPTEEQVDILPGL